MIPTPMGTLLDLVQAAAPGLGIKSGQWYWLNDWRRQQQQARLRFTYGDMADHLHSLMQTWMWLKAQPGPNTYAEFCRLNPQPFQQSS